MSLGLLANEEFSVKALLFGELLALFLPWNQWQLFRNNQGAKGLDLPSILEEARVFGTYSGIFVDYTCFSESRCTRKLRLKQEVDFLVKKLCVWPLV